LHAQEKGPKEKGTPEACPLRGFPAMLGGAYGSDFRLQTADISKSVPTVPCLFTFHFFPCSSVDSVAIKIFRFTVHGSRFTIFIFPCISVCFRG